MAIPVNVAICASYVAARLQAAQGCERPTVLRVLESGGHTFFASDREANAEILAFAALYAGLVPRHGTKGQAR